MMADPRPLPLSNADWKRLSKMAGLQETARPELEGILGMGKFLANLDSTLCPPSETRQRLAKVRQKAEDLLEALRDCEPDVFMAILDGDNLEFADGALTLPARLTRLRLLEDCSSVVRGLAQWLSRAEGMVSRGKPGDKNTGAHVVTRHIDSLLRRHGKPGLTMTEKASDPGRDLLEACFDLLEMNVTPMAMIRGLTKHRKVPA